MATSTHKKSTKALTRRVAELERRLAEVETQLAVMSNQRPHIEAWDSDYRHAVSEPAAATHRKEPRRTKIGRPPRISDDCLIDNRDKLYTLVHTFKSDFEQIVLKARSQLHLTKLLTTLRPGGQDDGRLTHLLRHADLLWKFLQSPRFANDVYRISEAMAGVPAISCRTSTDRCGNLRRPRRINRVDSRILQS